MKAYANARFVRYPRTVRDLIQAFPRGQSQNYEIVKRIELDELDYENFIHDMLVDRQFIEENASLCAEGEVWRCLYVYERGQRCGILIMPEPGAYVKWAAYISEVESCE